MPYNNKAIPGSAQFHKILAELPERKGTSADSI